MVHGTVQFYMNVAQFIPIILLAFLFQKRYNWLASDAAWTRTRISRVAYSLFSLVGAVSAQLLALIAVYRNGRLPIGFVVWIWIGLGILIIDLSYWLWERIWHTEAIDSRHRPPSTPTTPPPTTPTPNVD